MKTPSSSRENTLGSAQTAQNNMGSQTVSLPHVEADPVETMYASEEALSFKLYLNERLIRKMPPKDLWYKILHAVGNQGIATDKCADAEKNNTKFTLG
jgi:hypothetical protein